MQEILPVICNAENLSQFYVRDAPADVAAAGLEAFIEFMLDTTKLVAIFQRLDEVQLLAY